MSDPPNPTDPTTDPLLNEQFDPADSPSLAGGGASAGMGAHGGAHANGAGDANGANGASDLHRLSEVPMELSVEIGRTHITVGETLQLRAGSVVTLDRLAGEPVDLLVNGTPIARGEVVVVDEQFGLRVTQIVEGDPTARRPAQAPPQDAQEPMDTTVEGIADTDSDEMPEA
jgi:flagellar motor switch protein FliN